MKKRGYEPLFMELLPLERTDVLTASGGDGFDLGHEIGGPES